MLIRSISGIRGLVNEDLKNEEITKYANSKLSNFKLCASPEAAIISVLVPEWMNIRVANSALDKMGIFLNAIEFPAVPINKQRFRISLTADHTKKDIDYLVNALKSISA